jgi:hypothetical protein
VCKERDICFSGRIPLPVEHLPYLLRETFEREGLGEKSPTILLIGLDIEIFRFVPRHEQNAHLGKPGPEQRDQFSPLHLGHDDVSDKKLNWRAIRVRYPERMLSILRFKDVVALKTEYSRDSRPHDVLVFHNEHDFATSTLGHRPKYRNAGRFV